MYLYEDERKGFVALAFTRTRQILLRFRCQLVLSRFVRRTLSSGRVVLCVHASCVACALSACCYLVSTLRASHVLIVHVVIWCLRFVRRMHSYSACCELLLSLVRLFCITILTFLYFSDVLCKVAQFVIVIVKENHVGHFRLFLSHTHAKST